MGDTEDKRRFSDQLTLDCSRRNLPCHAGCGAAAAPVKPAAESKVVVVRQAGEMLETIIKWGSVVTVLAAVLAIGRKIYRMALPGTAEISYELVLDNSRPDSISVKITNRSNSAIYIRLCTVRSTYSIWQLIWRHIRRPFLSPRLYSNLRYNGPVYQFINGEPVKLDPAQLKEFRIEIREHPLNAIYGPMLLAKVLLTTGRVIRSKRMEAPMTWRMIGQRGR